METQEHAQSHAHTQALQNCNLYIDSREAKLIEYLTYLNINFIQKQLEIGDIIIESLVPQFNIIFERKTYQDLSSSIRDGRYKEQKLRLISSNPPHNCVYIFEGDRNDIDASTLDGVVYHSMFRDKMHVLFTDSVKNTGDLILSIFNKCIKNPSKFVATNGETDYVASLKVKTCKAKNINKETCYILQLCQIPTISHIIAKEIAARYGTWKELISALENAPNKISVLTTIPMIGDKKAKTIIEYLDC